MKRRFITCRKSKDVNVILEQAKNALELDFKIEIIKYDDIYMLNIYE